MRHGLEREAVRHLRNAQVLCVEAVLGGSQRPAVEQHGLQSQVVAI